MHVNQAGQHRHTAQVDDFVAGLRCYLRRRANGLDRLAGHNDGLPIQQLARLYIEQVSGAHQRASSRRL